MAYAETKIEQVFFYKTQNFLSTSQVTYRIKANSNVLCLISLLCAITISIMSATFAVYAALADSIPVYAPFSYLCSNIDKSAYNKVIDAAKSDKQIALKSVTQFDVISAKASLKGYRVSFGRATTRLGQPFQLDVVKLSNYNAIVKSTGAKPGKGNKDAIPDVKLSSSECVFLDGNYSDDYSKNQTGNNIAVDYKSNRMNFKIINTALFKYTGVQNACATIVVADSDYSKYFATADTAEKKSYTGLMFSDSLKSQSLVNEIDSIIQKEKRDGSYIGFYKMMFSLYGTYIFIGAFLGILFLLAAGSIIFYKQLMEARDEETRYDVLKKIGLNKAEAKQIIRKQMAFIYILPLVVGILHSAIALVTYRKLMSAVATDSPILENSLFVVLIYMLIYGLFYTLSVSGYMRTVWNKKV